MNLRDTIDLIRQVTKLEEQDILDLELLVNKANDPVVLATLIVALIEERRKTNRLLQEILSLLKARQGETEELSEQDERILTLVKERGMVCAEDVKNALGYKGLNAASARLNALVRRGILQKVRRGRKVYFRLAP